MNVAYVLIALALFYILLAVRGMNMKSPSAIFGNLAVSVVLSLVAVFVYPHHEAYLHKKAIERLRSDYQVELDRISALNAAFSSPEITRDYLKENQKD